MRRAVDAGAGSGALVPTGRPIHIAFMCAQYSNINKIFTRNPCA
ncbi:hypothetical protein HMPREF3293_01834 [Christensenella minuta]|uniref:Uncharacterized protein n=1 Tax=Christensenella minuta TaxID=626937 RepID=A0A136Q3J6_9FIRM|nr:hypothetical protein HMPREF3293_01834 [Christensenella minuta]